MSKELNFLFKKIASIDIMKWNLINIIFSWKMVYEDKKKRAQY
jgi:hypothetical protein